MINNEMVRGESCFNQVYRGSFQDAVQIANRYAKERSSKVTLLNCEELKQPGDLAGVLTSLQDNDILFLYGVNNISDEFSEGMHYFKEAIKDKQISIYMDRYQSQSLDLELNAFNLMVFLNEGESLPAYLQAAIYDNAFVYICNNYELKDYIGNLCRELDSSNIPFYYSSKSDCIGWNSIVDTISTITSAKYVLSVFKTTNNDEYGLDEIDFSKRTKNSDSIIEYDIDVNKASPSDLCSFIEEKFGIIKFSFTV